MQDTNAVEREVHHVIFTFEQYIPDVLKNNHKYNCVRGYIV
jgi:hypothetical protein